MICSRCPEPTDMRVTDSRQLGKNGRNELSFALSPKVTVLVAHLNEREIDFRLRRCVCPACQLIRTTIELDAGLVANYVIGSPP